MPKASAALAGQRAQGIRTGAVVGAVVVAGLYWAQAVFIPLALAVFLTFLLSPPASALQRRGLGRIPSVLLVVALAGALLGGLAWLVTDQVTRLAAGLPAYTENIRGKIKRLREAGEGSISDRLGRMVEEITGELKSAPPAAAPGGGSLPPGGEPPRVVVRPEGPAWLARVPGVLGPVLGPVGAVGLACVLAFFMLLKREDLRNRFIRLVGRGHMTVTTKAVDDAGSRISRFLVMQAVVNGTYGLAWGVGLLLVGVEYALLWGLLAAVLRYVPYVGAPVAALLPIALSVAQFPGWWQPLAVVGLLLVLELVSNNVIEPWLYGMSIGVSEVASLVAAAFWAFLWGPIGLVLSGPLTVCLVVLGKHVPQLQFFDVLLGDEPALDPDVSYYQRLLARDQDEAAELALAQVKASPPEQVYDGLLVPALNHMKRDRERDELTEADEQYVLRATGELLEDLGERKAVEAEAAQEAGEPAAEGAEGPAAPRVLILGYPARDAADQLALEMLRQLLDPARWEVVVSSSESTAGEMVALAEERRPALICVGSLPPSGLAHTRYLCKRLRARCPSVRIVVGRWGLKGNVEANKEQLQEAGADATTTTLLETVAHLNGVLPVLDHDRERHARADGAAGRA